MQQAVQFSLKSSNRSGISTISAIFILLSFFISTLNAQWITQSPVPTGLDIRGIAAPSANRVYIVTSDDSWDNSGALFQSNDGGLSWAQRDIPVSLHDPLNGIFFLDGQYGWTYGNDNYRTTDGGITWIQMTFLGSTYFMKFYNQLFGVATGNFGRQISRDGGITWLQSPEEIHSFNFLNSQTGLGFSATGVFKTSNGGNTFTNVLPGDAKSAVYLTPDNIIGIVGGNYVRSTDGGSNWTIHGSAGDMNRLIKISDDIILSWHYNSIFSSASNFFRSTDGGITWSAVGGNITEGLFALTYVTASSLIASDVKGNLFRSTDTGVSWTQTFSSPGAMPGFLSTAVPQFPTAETGYFAYGSGLVLKTTDGGASWFILSGGTDKTLNAINRFPDGRLIAAGEGGALLIKNHNSPWRQKPIGTGETIAGIQILNNNDVVGVTNNARVYISTNGGENWSRSDTSQPSGLTVSDIYFKSLTEGWITGMGYNPGAIYKTGDGGLSWTPVPGIAGTYKAIDFAGNFGWVVNSSGFLYRTIDNGNNWIINDSLPGNVSVLEDIDFYNQNVGYVVGRNGYAARSSNGGVTWEILFFPGAVADFSSIYLINENTFWLSTFNNKAYYSSNGGISWSIMDIGSGNFGSFNSITASASGEAWAAGFQGYIEYFQGPPPPPENQPPVASFRYVSQGLTFQFTDLSTDPDGNISQWEWEFEDSVYSNLQNPLYTFPSPGTYPVRLTVTDNVGGSNTRVRFVVARELPGGTFGDFTEVSPLDSIFITPDEEDFWVISTAPADFDGDGDIDIAVAGYYVVYNQSVQDRLLILKNEGEGTPLQWNFSYVNVEIGNLTFGNTDMRWGDIDGDGDLDLVVGTDLKTVIFRNNTGTLQLTDTELPGYYEINSQAEFDLRSISLADFDNDGDLDILIPSVWDADSSTFRTVLMRNDGMDNNGNFIFTEVDAGFPPTKHAQSSWADFDGDQDLDLLLINIVPNSDEGFIKLFRNLGNGNFSEEDLLGGLTIEHGEAHWGDYDGDGDLDLLVAGHVKEANGSYNTVLRVYRNDGNGFTSLPVIECASCVGWIDISAATWGDYDADGDIDILVAGSYNSGSNISGRAKIYINTNGTFVDSGNDLPAPRASGSRGGTFSWFDLDGDGDLDYFIAGQYFVPGGNGLVEAQMHLYVNNPASQNNAPAPPSNLTASVGENSTVVFNWTPGSDDQTPTAALTYDLEIFRDDLPVNLPKRLPEPGNISAADQWVISGLPDGHYKWRLKTVDAAFFESEPASGTFNVGVVSVNELLVPIIYELSQNYPNPFNPSTRIKYSIPTEGLVIIKLYNIIGEEVATLINEIKKEGFYELTFDGTGLASGVYIYKIISGSFIDIKKMILLK